MNKVFYLCSEKITAHNNKLISTNTIEPFVLKLKIKYLQLVIGYLIVTLLVLSHM